MVRILLRKQFLELVAQTLPKENKKKKKSGRKHKNSEASLEKAEKKEQKKNNNRKNKAANVGAFILLYGIIVLSVAMAFMGASDALLGALMPLKMYWAFFALLGIMGLFVGVFISLIFANVGFFKAKDNDLLLSMPIKPWQILLARMIPIYVLGTIFAAASIVPSMIRFKIELSDAQSSIYEAIGLSDFAFIIRGIILTLFMGLIVLALGCLFGWLVAVITSKVRRKSLFTMVVSLTLLGGYYYFYFQANKFLSILVANSEAVSLKIKSFAYPFYAFGNAMAGDMASLGIFAAIAGAFFAIVYYILSKNFMSVATADNKAVRAEYKADMIKSTDVKKALFMNEVKRFTSIPTYMMNCGLGSIMMPIAAVFLLIKADAVREYVDLAMMYAPDLWDLLPAAAAVATCMLTVMNAVTMPAISLEGKNIWITQTLPVDAKDVLNAKQKLHYVISIPPAVLMAAALSFVLGLEFQAAVLTILVVISFIQLDSALGLYGDLRKPNLTWTNVAAPIKQSLNSVILIFGGWIVSLIIAAGCYFLRNVVSCDVMLAAVFVLFILITRLVNNWINTKGAEKFAHL